MFKLNLKDRADRLRSAVSRFPLSVAAAFIGTLAMMVFSQIDFNDHLLAEENLWLVRLTITSVIGFLLFYAVHLFAEGRKKNDLLISGLLVAAFLVVFYVFQMKFLDVQLGETKTMVRTFFAIAASFLAAIVLPYVGGKSKDNSIWQYALELGIRIAEAFVVFGILFGGIAAILGSIDMLFNARIEGIVYQQIFIVLAGLVAPLFVLAGIPKDLSALEKSQNFPKFIRFMTKYILIPLILVYAVVVYVYLLSIIVTFEWPKYGVAELISGYLTVGLATYVLTYPERGRDSLMGRFHKWFFALVIPMALALLAGIGVRIEEYGFTVDRYLVVAFGIFVISLAGYYLASKKKDLRWIPGLAIIFGAVMMLGPVSAFSVTRMSQEAIVTKAIESGEEVKGLSSNMRSIFEISYPGYAAAYLGDLGLELEVTEETYSYELAREAVIELGFDPEEYYVYSSEATYGKWVDLNPMELSDYVDIRGYSYHVDFNMYAFGGEDETLKIVALPTTERPLRLADNILEFDGESFDLNEMVEAYGLRSDRAPDLADLTLRGSDFRIQIIHLNGYYNEEEASFDTESIQGYILIK